MRIVSLSYSDKDTTWCLNQIQFKKLSLLVGASGVGKTQILRSILRLRALTRGESIEGIKWKISFTTSDNSTYEWSGEYESLGGNIIAFSFKEEDEDEKNNPKILWEKVFRNEELIVKREKDHILFIGQETVKLPQDKSILSLLKEEELIEPAYNGFQRIIFSDQVESRRNPQKFNPDFITKERLLKKYKTIDAIREADENFITKLFLAYYNASKVMRQISDRFIDIFPFVEELRVAPLDFEQEESVPSLFREIPFIQIKEKNIKKWIIQPMMSSGMYRVLMHLSELYLSAKGTVILIDEFENSLGVNCIDELTIDLQTSSDRDLQFIITSHHPYIINQVHYDNWKLITRSGSTVNSQDAISLINFTKSKQEAFIQLTQLEEFTTGISN